MTTAFWIGQDGNVYVHQADGSAINYGKPLGGVTNGGVETQLGSIQGKQINDPNPQYRNTANVTPNAAPNNPTGTTTPAAPVFNQAGADNTQKTIDQIAPLLQAALASEDQTHANSNAAFDAQQAQQQQAHDTSTVTNQQNYDSNFMDSIRAGVKGLGGLMAMLRGTGAAGGTADDQVRDVVGGITSNDIRDGADTQKANQTGLDSSLSTFLTDLKGKRQQNEDTYANNRSAIQRDSNTQLQDLYSKMAGFYGDAGRTAEANSFMARAGDLTPQIAADSRSHVSAYDTTPVVVHAPNLTAFSAPSQPDVAVAPQDGQVGSGIFSIGKRKDQTADVPTAPVAAAQGA